MRTRQLIPDDREVRIKVQFFLGRKKKEKFIFGTIKNAGQGSKGRGMTAQINALCSKYMNGCSQRGEHWQNTAVQGGNAWVSVLLGEWLGKAISYQQLCRRQDNI